MKPVPLAEAVDESRFGGKAANLARALQAGLPVPPGFALDTELVNWVAGGAPADSLLHAFSSLGPSVAVRSSAVGEDSKDASFAGQHLTALNLTSFDDMIKAIREVHASAFSASASEYRRLRGVGGEARIAVVLQRLVHPECAGVLFTCDPVSGRDERVIEAAWGLGESVVGGLVVPDSYRMARDGTIIETTLGEKDVMLVPSKDGRTREQAVDPRLAADLCLNPGRLAELHRLAEKCESCFGPKLDIEWAFADGRLYLLQCRAITRGA
jgi:pyruvate,water dikinase